MVKNNKYMSMIMAGGLVLLAGSVTYVEGSTAGKKKAKKGGILAGLTTVVVKKATGGAKKEVNKFWKDLTDDGLVQWSWYFGSKIVCSVPIVGAVAYVLAPTEGKAAVAVAMKRTMKAGLLSGLLSIGRVGSKFFTELNGFTSLCSNGVALAVVGASLCMARKVVGACAESKVA